MGASNPDNLASGPDEKSPIERKPVDNATSPEEQPSVERSPTLPPRPVSIQSKNDDIDEKATEAGYDEKLPQPNNGFAVHRKPVSTKTPPQSIKIDKSQPEDFEGEVATTNELPPPELIKKIEDYIVLDRHGKSHPFSSLYTGSNVARRVLVIFVRHFFCGVRQPPLQTPKVLTLNVEIELPRVPSVPV